MQPRRLATAIYVFVVTLALTASMGKAIGSELDNVNITKVQALFESRKFSELSSLFKRYSQLTEQDIRWEFAIHDAFNVFNTSSSEYETLLDEWVQNSRNDWVPLLARAVHYDGLAWRARGGKWAKDTSEAQFRGMAEGFALASQDIRAALRIDPRIFYAYCILMKMNRSTGDQERGKLLVRKALEIAPASYLIRRQHMQLLLPRWGGSYEAMEKFAKDSMSYFGKNKLLNSLEGLIYWDKASVADDEGDHIKAIGLYKRSLSYGETWNTLYDLAWTRMYHREYKAARQIIDHAIANLPKLPDRYIGLRPDLSDAYKLRLRISVAQRNWEEALRDLDKIETARRQTKEIEEIRKRAGDHLISEGHAQFKKDPNKAIKLYTLHLRFCPENAEAYCWRGIAYDQTGKSETAEADLRKAISLSPRLFVAYKGLDALLFKKKRLDEIIELWTRFIALEPSNADAYLERGGTYFHKGDIPSALGDAKRACELGNGQACQRATQLKKKTKL